MADAPADDTVQDDPSEVAGQQPPTLDQVHDISQAKVEAEDADAGNETDTDGEQPAQSDADDDTVDDDKPDEANEADEEAEPEPLAESAAVESAPPAAPQPAAELDVDITKNATGKVAIKDAEGKTFYFNNLDEVPDDFEPQSYKALMVGVSALDRKAIVDEAKAEADKTTAAQAAEDAATKERVDAMNKSWEEDTQALVSAGLFPKDPTKLEAAKAEVYDYMESEMKKNNVIISFNQAYKSMMYDKQQAQAKADQKKADDAKKARGGVVQPGSGSRAEPATSNRGGKIIEAPPQGVGLDAVHARAIGGL